ncbi:MAG: YraN family protein [Gammaproteobacteria bacterium]
MAGYLESGHAAERLAERLLAKRGLTPVASNYRCRYGEIDLIMTEAETLVVVEVRYRRHTTYVNPAASVNLRKCLRIARATEHFLQRNRRWRDAAVRFDVVGLHGRLADPEMNWIRGAFTIDTLSDDLDGRNDN